MDSLSKKSHRCDQDIDQARRFLEALDPSTTNFTFQCYSDSPEAKERKKIAGQKAEAAGKKPFDPLGKTLHGSLEDHLDELIRLNDRGASICVTVNATDLAGREKRNIVQIRSVYRELDAAANDIPGIVPHIEVCTSPGKKHEYAHVEPHPPIGDEFEGVMRHLTKEYGNDPAAKDRSRVLRMPGFKHWKSGVPHLVELIVVRDHARYSWGYIKSKVPPIDPEAKKVEVVWGPSDVADVERVAQWINLNLAAKLESAQPTIDWELGPVPEDIKALFAANDCLNDLAPPTEDKVVDSSDSAKEGKLIRTILESSAINGVPDEKLAATIRDAWAKSNLPPLGARKTKDDRDADYPRRAIKGVVGRFLGEGRGISTATKTSNNDRFNYGIEQSCASWMLGRTPKPIEYVVPKLLPAHCVGIIAAQGGTGKTYSALQLALSVATGCRLFGRFEMEDIGPAVLMSSETSTDNFHRRLWYTVELLKAAGEWTPEHESRLDDLRLVPVGGKHTRVLKQDQRHGAQWDMACVNAIVEQLKPVSPRLVVIDSLSRFYGANENDATDAAQFIDAMEWIREKVGAKNLLVVHHSNKRSSDDENSGQTSGRGSSVFVDNARWMLNMTVLKKLNLPPSAKPVEVPTTQEKDYVRCNVAKINDGPTPPSFMLVKQLHGVLRYMEPHEIQSRVKCASEFDTLNILKLVNGLKDDKALKAFVNEYHEKITKRREDATAMVEGLLTRGLLTNGPDPNDRRKNPLKLTPEGKDWLNLHGAGG